MLYFPEIVLTPVKKDRLHTEIATFRSKKDSFQSKGSVWKLMQKALLFKKFFSRTLPWDAVDRELCLGFFPVDSVKNLCTNRPENAYSIITKWCYAHYLTMKLSGAFFVDTTLNPVRVTSMPSGIFQFCGINF